MSLNGEMSSEALFPVPMEVKSPEPGTEGFRQEGGDRNDDLLQELMEFLEFEQETEIPWAEIDVGSSELAPIQPEKESTEAKIDDGLLLLEELDRNELFPEVNQFFGMEEELQIQCAETLNNEQDPSTGENQDLNLKENIDRGMEDIQEAKEERKTSAPSKTGSNHSKNRDDRGKCCECSKVYLSIASHSRRNHNGNLEKCTTSGCKIYFASAQQRMKHEQQEHQERKQFQCQFCHYSAEHKGNLGSHILRKHSEKKIKCRQQKCGKMFASEADLRVHVKMCHKLEKCPSCGREMSLAAMYEHKRYGRCRGKVAE